MNDAFWKAVTTSFIWLLAAGVVITGFIMAPESAIWITIVVMIAAMIPSAMMWDTKHDDKSTTVMQSGQEKLKREDMQTSKMQLLLELMDDDEREAFKRQLKRQILNNGSNVNSEGELLYDAETYEQFMGKS